MWEKIIHKSEDIELVNESNNEVTDVENGKITVMAEEASQSFQEVKSF